MVDEESEDFGRGRGDGAGDDVTFGGGAHALSSLVPGSVGGRDIGGVEPPEYVGCDDEYQREGFPNRVSGGRWCW